MNRRRSIVHRRQQGSPPPTSGAGVYNGHVWHLDARYWFNVELPDPEGGPPESKSFETYDQMTAFVDREIAARAKFFKTELRIVVCDGHPSGENIRPLVITGINRSSNQISGKGGKFDNVVVLPDVPSMHELLQLYQDAERRVSLIHGLIKPFQIEARRRPAGRPPGSYGGQISIENYEATLKELEVEYAEKRAAAYEFDPGAELRMALEERKPA